MQRVLVIQSRQRPETVAAEQEEYNAALAGAQVDFLSALDEKLSWTNPNEVLAPYGAMLLGGSGDFDLHGGREPRDPARLIAAIILTRLKMFVQYAIAKDMPVLGVCFGHQLIAEMYGGTVTNDQSQRKTGSFDVTLTEEGKRDPLFGSLPETFAAQYGHKDSVTSLPEGAVLLAHAPACKFSALRYGSHVYTTQFHPELTGERMAHKLNTLSRQYLPEGVTDAEAFIRPSLDASRIIPLFLEKVVGTK